MIRIHNIPALNVAIHFITRAHSFANATRILLEPNGTLVATDGFAMIVSEHAHDLTVRRTLTFEKAPRIRQTTTSVQITSDGRVLEYRGEDLVKEHDAGVSIEENHAFPRYDLIIRQAHGTKLATPNGPMCSISGAAIAKAYGLQSTQGTWLPTCATHFMYLNNTLETDTIIAGTVRVETPNRFAPEEPQPNQVHARNQRPALA